MEIRKSLARRDCNFHFDEMVWRSEAGLIHQAFTELTAIHDDLEFEREIFLIRTARIAAGLGNQRLVHYRQTRLLGAFLQSFLAWFFGVCLLAIEKFFGLSERGFKFLNLFGSHNRSCHNK